MDLDKTCPPIKMGSIKKNEKNLNDALKIIRLLSNPLRLKIAVLLSKSEMCTCHLESLLDAEQTLISHHLREFKDLSLLNEKRKGRWRFYSIKSGKIKKILSSIGLVRAR